MRSASKPAASRPPLRSSPWAWSRALLNIAYAVHRLNRNKSWHVLLESGREFMLAILIGINFSLAVTLMGKGMLLLGALGASIGWGIQQAMQMTGGQLLGFVSGEWRGVRGAPRCRCTWPSRC